MSSSSMSKMRGYCERQLAKAYLAKLLRLVTDSGILLWRTELPYTVVRGAKNLDEAMVTRALLTHVRVYQNTIGLIGLGSMAVALQNVEQPIAQARD